MAIGLQIGGLDHRLIDGATGPRCNAVDNERNAATPDGHGRQA